MLTFELDGRIMLVRTTEGHELEGVPMPEFSWLNANCLKCDALQILDDVLAIHDAYIQQCSRVQQAVPVDNVLVMSRRPLHRCRE